MRVSSQSTMGAQGSIHTLLLSLHIFILCSCSAIQSEDQGHITVEVFSKGLDFVKDLLIEKAETSMVPMDLPKIEKTTKIPLIGKVKMEASNITLFEVHITSSIAKTVDKGIVIDVNGATANLSTNWKYSYSTWLIHISDEGEALMEVEGMEIGISLLLKNEGGSIKLTVLECRCNVKDLSIILYGGASWLYQGFVDAFKGTITSKIENAISNKVKEGIKRLNYVLGSVPKEVAIRSLATLNVTFIGDPVSKESSLAFAIDGLFSRNNRISVSESSSQHLEGQFFCNNPVRMASISVHRSVLESASLVYYAADKLHWFVDKLPDQSLLNTTSWNSIVPQLCEQYPNDDMNLNISVSSPPVMKITRDEIDVMVPLDVIIDVLDAGETKPVICVSLEINVAISLEVRNNVLAGSVRFDEFTMSLKWSKVGDLSMNLIQTFMSTLVKTVVIPYINTKLNKGFQLPNFHGYQLQNTRIGYTGSWIVACSDVSPINSDILDPTVLQSGGRVVSSDI